MSRALVLGGGGVSGIAWELGVLRGLEEAGVAAGDWSLVVGTSAGAIVGARILTEPDLARWHEHETRPYDDEDRELILALGGRVGLAAMAAGRHRVLGWAPTAWLLARTAESMVRNAARPPRPATVGGAPAGTREVLAGDERIARLGSMARAARTPPEAAFLDTIRAYLHGADVFPERLLVTAIDAIGGSTVIVDHTSGVPLDRAVAASAAVPILFPTIRFLGRRWMDGGMSSLVHVGLARDADQILVIAPLDMGVRSEVDALRAEGRQVELIVPGEASAKILGFGTGLLDPARRPAAARAGLEDGRREGRAMLERSTRSPEASREVRSVA